MDEPDYEAIARRPLLSPEEEVVLIGAIRAGDEVAWKRFVEANLRLVLNVAKPYRKIAVREGVPFERLFWAGREGLLGAIERFDPKRGYRFSTYATHWIRQAIGRVFSPATEDEEERALLRAVRSGDDIARARLLDLYASLVERIARETHQRFRERRPFEDLRLAGQAGLLQAAQSFDPDLEFRFSTYATHWIRHSIAMWVDKP